MKSVNQTEVSAQILQALENHCDAYTISRTGSETVSELCTKINSN